MFRIFALSLLLVATTAGAVWAQDAVDSIARRAYELLPQAKISTGEVIGAEKAKTLAYPLVPRELTEFVVKRGQISGFAAHCGLDWQKGYFLPMMSFLRSREKSFTDYQWAYIGILHGVSMGSAEDVVKDKPCDDAMKQNLQKEAK